MSAAVAAHNLGPIAAIPIGEARVFRVEAREIAVFRCRSGAVYASSAACPHQGGPLADGLLGGASVICPLHGFVFDLRTGEAPGRECGRLATYPVSVGLDGTFAVDLR